MHYVTHFISECERANSKTNQKDSQSHEFNKNYKVNSNFTVKDKQSEKSFQRNSSAY